MTHLSTLRTQILHSLELTAVVLAMAITPAFVAGSAHGATRSLDATNAAGSCGLPLVHDQYSGFHIGVPSGWTVSSYNGLIQVSKDTAATEMAMVYPALLTKGLTPASFFAGVTKVSQQVAKNAGNTINFRLISKPGQLPLAIVTGRDGQQTEQGRAGVFLLNQKTALASQQIVFFLYWAPPSQLGSDSGMLARIGQCYGPEAGTLYQMYSDQVFSMALPLGWSVADEGQDSIDIVGDSKRAMASYLLTMVPPSAGATTPRALLEYIFQQVHIQIGKILSSTDTPAQPGADGTTQGTEIMEFTGTFQGSAVHGIVSVYCLAGSAATTGVMRLGMATTGEWNAVNSGLIRLVGSLQHSFAQDQAQIDRINQQQQQQMQQEQQFDNVINNVQDVQDPNTGKIYQAPYDSYAQTGPSGPGYYLDQGGTLVKLNEINHD